MNCDVFPKTIEISQDSLFGRLADGHVLVTGNNRLARISHQDYTRWRQDRGDSQWLTPRIFSWTHWLDQLWEEASLDNHDGTQYAIPGTQQLNQLWQLVIDRQPGVNPLLHVDALAIQLRDTRSLAREWRLDFRSPDWRLSENENHRAFVAWNQAFELRCKEQNWLPPEDRAVILTELARSAKQVPASAVDLLGFDEYSPAQASLLHALSGAVPVTEVRLAARGGQGTQWFATDAREELEIMARWARHWLKVEPESRIAIIVPGLANRRGEVQRALRRILQPNDRLSGAARPWNISLGQPLAKAPMIRAALDLLGLLDFRIDIQQASNLLRSPWIRGSGTELEQRALLEKCLRSRYPRQLNLSELLYRSREWIRYDHEGQPVPDELQQAQPWASPIMASIVQSLIKFQENNKTRLAPSAWAERFDQLLGSVGWPSPGDNETAPQRDHDWQSLQAWKKALGDLASLDIIQPSMNRNEASGRLRHICAQTIFQASTAYCRLQVLGVYEATGLHFDHAWVLGLHHANWPESARPNPFIPLCLQLKNGLPHCSPQREFEVAKGVTRRLLECSEHIVFSAPARVDDEAIIPSPLLRHLPELSRQELPHWIDDSWAERISNAPAPALEKLDSPGGAQGHDPRGGSTILKNQALCPFRAFAESRLMAEPLDAPANGISPAQHGSLLHGALELFWKEVVCLSTLQAFDELELKSHIARHVNAALDNDRSLTYRVAFRKVEKSRLERHMLAFIELEKQREPFEAVAFEKELLPRIEGQTVRLIVDRIDRLSNGKLAIVDYKSGMISPAKWFGDRPEDPQLPLYAISAGEAPDAVVLAVIREDGCLFRGIARRDGVFPGLPPKATKTNQYLVDAGQAFPETIEQWRVTLHRLMRSFLAGEAAIDPKDGRKTCRNSYCNLQSLCRIDELDPMSALAEDSIS